MDQSSEGTTRPVSRRDPNSRYYQYRNRYQEVNYVGNVEESRKYSGNGLDQNYDSNERLEPYYGEWTESTEGTWDGEGVDWAEEVYPEESATQEYYWEEERETSEESSERTEWVEPTEPRYSRSRGRSTETRVHASNRQEWNAQLTPRSPDPETLDRIPDIQDKVGPHDRRKYVEELNRRKVKAYYEKLRQREANLQYQSSSPPTPTRRERDLVSSPRHYHRLTSEPSPGHSIVIPPRKSVRTRNKSEDVPPVNVAVDYGSMSEQERWSINEAENTEARLERTQPLASHWYGGHTSKKNRYPYAGDESSGVSLPMQEGGRSHGRRKSSSLGYREAEEVLTSPAGEGRMASGEHSMKPTRTMEAEWKSKKESRSNVMNRANYLLEEINAMNASMYNAMHSDQRTTDGEEDESKETPDALSSHTAPEVEPDISYKPNRFRAPDVFSTRKQQPSPIPPRPPYSSFRTFNPTKNPKK